MVQVQIAGTGMTPFGTHSDRSGRDMFADAALEALDDAGVGSDAIDEIFYGNFIGTLSENQGHQERSDERVITFGPAR